MSGTITAVTDTDMGAGMVGVTMTTTGIAITVAVGTTDEPAACGAG